MSLREKLEAARVALGKRMGREPFSFTARAAEPVKPAPGKKPAAAVAPARDGEKLLAGSLAHEFLTHGTVLGRRIEPSHAAAAARADEKPKLEEEPKPKRRRRYAEVSWLLMVGGAHVPGVVNPTQLGRWLHIDD